MLRVIESNQYVLNIFFFSILPLFMKRISEMVIRWEKNERGRVYGEDERALSIKGKNEKKIQ